MDDLEQLRYTCFLSEPFQKQVACVKKAMYGEKRSRTCKKIQYSNGSRIGYNYAAKQVDDSVLEAFGKTG